MIFQLNTSVVHFQCSAFAMSSRHLNSDLVESDDEIPVDTAKSAPRSWLTQPTGPTVDTQTAATWRSWARPSPATVMRGGEGTPTPRPPPPKAQVGVAAAMHAASAVAHAAETAAKANIIAARLMTDLQKASSAITKAPAFCLPLASPPAAKSPPDKAPPAKETAVPEYKGKGKAETVAKITAKAKAEAKQHAQAKSVAKVTAKAKTEAKQTAHKRPATAKNANAPANKRPAAAPANDSAGELPEAEAPAVAPALDAADEVPHAVDPAAEVEPAEEPAAEVEPALSHTWQGRRPPKNPAKLAEFRRKQKLHFEARRAEAVADPRANVD